MNKTGYIKHIINSVQRANKQAEAAYWSLRSIDTQTAIELQVADRIRKALGLLDKVDAITIDITNAIKAPVLKIEPKFKVGDKVRILTHQGTYGERIGEIDEIIIVDPYDKDATYYLDRSDGDWYSDSDLELYTESSNLSHDSANCDK